MEIVGFASVGKESVRDNSSLVLLHDQDDAGMIGILIYNLVIN